MSELALSLNPRICLHIYLHTDTDHPQSPCLYGSTLDVCSHNPLVPGSSPGGPTSKKATSVHSASGFSLRPLVINFHQGSFSPEYVRKLPESSFLTLARTLNISVTASMGSLPICWPRKGCDNPELTVPG